MYKWLKYNSFSGDQNRTFPWVRALLGYLDIRPNLIKEKRKLDNRLKSIELPRIAHIHTPKTGGTYTNHLKEYFPHLNFSHVVVRQNRSDKWCPVGLTPIHSNKIKGYYTFATVRNPLLFLISYYHHVLGNKKFENVNHYDYQNAQKGFEYLVNVILSREDKWPSRKFLFPNLFDQSGNIVVDWVNKNETLDDDLKQLLIQFDFVHKPQKKQRVAIKKPYEEYYSQSLFDKVCKAYEREMTLFGYDGYESYDPKVDMHKFKVNKISYKYDTDELSWLEK